MIMHSCVSFKLVHVIRSAHEEEACKEHYQRANHVFEDELLHAVVAETLSVG